MIERVVFMGTPEFAVPALKAVAAQFEVVGVYTQPDRPVGRGMQLTPSAVKKEALALGLKIFQPPKLNDPQVFAELQKLQPSVIVVVAYGQILKRSVLDLPRYGCINIHGSLLPQWRGAAPIHWSLLAGDEQTGVTTMKINEKLDSGEMLLKASTPVLARDTFQTLYSRLSDLGAELIVPTLQGLAEGTLVGIPQIDSEATLAPKITKEQGLLDCNDSAITIDRKVRALSPWPGVWFNAGGLGRIKIIEGKPWPDIKAVPQTLREKNGMLVIGTAAGAYECTRIQAEGKAPQISSVFINGLKGRGISFPIQLSSMA